MQLKEEIAKDLNIPMSLVENALANAFSRVRHIRIKKRSGGTRLIVQPSAKLKLLQRWLMLNVFSNLDVHDNAVAYIPGSSIRKNAERHKDKRFFLKVDLEQFFPSIRSDDLLPIIEEWHKKASPSWQWNDEAVEVIKRSCFDSQSRLPIGYPSSPIISNVVMLPFDVRLEAALKVNASTIGEVVYSRYADDMVFSTDKPDSCNAIYAIVRDLINRTTRPRIKINGKKIKFSSRSGGSALVTGLRICHDGHLTLHRKYKDHVRLLLSLEAKGVLDRGERRSLQGHLAYIKSVDPVFFTQLSHKLFLTIENLKQLPPADNKAAL